MWTCGVSKINLHRLLELETGKTDGGIVSNTRSKFSVLTLHNNQSVAQLSVYFIKSGVLKSVCTSD